MPDFEPDVEMETDDAPDSDSPELQEDLEPEADDEGVIEEEGEETPDGDAPDEEDVDEDYEEEEDAPAEGRSPAFQKLLDKYGGDYDKMADAYFEQANSTARAVREIRELRKMMEEQQAGKVDPKEIEEAINNDPFVKEIQEEKGSIEGELQRIQQEQYTLVQMYQSSQDAVKSLEGELKRADEVDAMTIRQDLAEKRQIMKDSLREFNANKRELGQLDRAKRATDRQLRDAEAKAQARLDQETNARQTATATAQAASREYEVGFADEAKRYGIPPNSQQYKFVRTIIKDRLINHMTQMDPDEPAIKIKEAVAYLMQEAADNLGLKPRFQKVSNMKRTATTPKRSATATQRGGGKKPPTDPTGKYWSPEYVERRAKKLLGG